MTRYQAAAIGRSTHCAICRSSLSYHQQRAGDICNAYLCSGLKQAERWACKDDTTRVYVVVREDNIIRRGAFVQPGYIRNYPLTDDLPGAERLAHTISMRH